MAQLVCLNAQIKCSFGTTPSNLMLTPENRVTTGHVAAATIMDNIPMKNIIPFGMCQTLTNPQVAAATTAAQGVLTPQPCIPVTAAPWNPGSPTVLISKKPALNSSSILMCNWGGVISVVSPGQMTVMVP